MIRYGMSAGVVGCVLWSSSAGAEVPAHWSEGMKDEAVEATRESLADHFQALYSAAINDDDSAEESARKDLAAALGDVLTEAELEGLSPLLDSQTHWSEDLKADEVSAVMSAIYDELLAHRSFIPKMEGEPGEFSTRAVSESVALELAVDSALDFALSQALSEEYRTVHLYEHTGVMEGSDEPDWRWSWADEWRVFWMVTLSRHMADFSALLTGGFYRCGDSSDCGLISQEARGLHRSTQLLLSSMQDPVYVINTQVIPGSLIYSNRRATRLTSELLRAYTDPDVSERSKAAFCEAHNAAASVLNTSWYLVSPICETTGADNSRDEFLREGCAQLRCENPVDFLFDRSECHDGVARILPMLSCE